MAGLSLEFQHSVALQELCRVCGRRVSPANKRRPMYRCSDYIDDLKRTFSISVEEDTTHIHPTHFCHACKGTRYNHKKGKTSAPQKIIDWMVHNDVIAPKCRFPPTLYTALHGHIRKKKDTSKSGRGKLAEGRVQQRRWPFCLGTGEGTFII